MRSLARDLGVRLGCGAHLERLRRTRAGAFDESAAVALQAVEEAGPAASQWLLPLRLILDHLPEVVLNERGVRRATHGNEVAPEDPVRTSTESLPGRASLTEDPA